MRDVGIMQGRLSPAPAGRLQAFPERTWRQEFADARALGFAHIEWLVTADGLERNPLLSPDGIHAIRTLSTASCVRVPSVCADCFIARPFVRVPAEEREASARLLTRIVEQAARLGAGVVVVPVLEGAAVHDDRDACDLLGALREPRSRAADLGVRIALETDLPVDDVMRILDVSGTPALGACFDTGNAAALGRDVPADIRALASVLADVHVKDRRRGGSSVGLGTGDADLPGALGALAEIGYEGPLVLETPVGDDPRLAARKNLAVVRAALPARAPRLAAP